VSSTRHLGGSALICFLRKSDWPRPKPGNALGSVDRQPLGQRDTSAPILACEVLAQWLFFPIRPHSHKKPKWDSDNCTGWAVGPGCPRGGDHVWPGWVRRSGPGSTVRRGSQVNHYTSVYRSIMRVAAGACGFVKRDVISGHA
jgi:hypothetical protein